MCAETIPRASSASVFWVGPLLTGHRGAGAYARENSLASFALAVTMGAEVIECDVRRTADGVLVLAHSGVVGSGRSAARIASLAYAAVRAREPDILTLPELLAHARAWDVLVNVDLKGQGAAAGIVEAVAATGWTARTVVTARAIYQLRLLRSLAPMLRLGLSRGSNPSPGLTYWPETSALVTNRAMMPHILPHTLHRIGVETAYLHHRVITPALIVALHAAGCGCYAWTVDDPDRATRLLSWGVDGITTNRPDVLRPLVSRSLTPGNRSAPCL